MMIKELMTPRTIGVIAGLTNFASLILNLGFTNAEALASPNPNVFSPFSQVNQELPTRPDVGSALTLTYTHCQGMLLI